MLVGVLVAAACASPATPAGSPPSSTSTAPSGPVGDGGPTDGSGAAAPGGTATDATVPASGPAVTVEPVSWRPCGGGVECATLLVPLDHDRPDDGRTVELALARKPATEPEQRIGPLVLNPGGPGTSGIEFLRGFSAADLGRRFDLVSWDPRGVGASSPLGCDGPTADRFRHVDSDPDSAAEQAQLDDAAAAVADACAASAGDLLAHLTTADTARDLDLIRQALGEEQLSYLGFSYGTDIGQQYAERFGDRVRAMVLDGVVDPSQDLAELLAGQTDGIQRSLDRIFDDCEASASCPLTDPRGTYDRVAARVERDPLPAGGAGSVGPSELALAAISSSYVPSYGPRLLSALAQADQGSGTGLATLASAYTSSGSLGAYLGVFCTDGPHPDLDGFRDLAARLEQRSALVGAAAANELLPCASWPVPGGSPRSLVRAEAAPPILVVGNTGDAATPYDNAVRVAAGLADGHLLTYAGEGHTSFNQSRCVRDAVVDYLTELAVPPDGTTCRS